MGQRVYVWGLGSHTFCHLATVIVGVGTLVHLFHCWVTSQGTVLVITTDLHYSVGDVMFVQDNCGPALVSSGSDDLGVTNTFYK